MVHLDSDFLWGETSRFLQSTALCVCTFALTPACGMLALPNKRFSKIHFIADVTFHNISYISWGVTCFAQMNKRDGILAQSLHFTLFSRKLCKGKSCNTWFILNISNVYFQFLFFVPIWNNCCWCPEPTCSTWWIFFLWEGCHILGLDIFPEGQLTILKELCAASLIIQMIISQWCIQEE